jgi:hypothetical protein
MASGWRSRGACTVRRGAAASSSAARRGVAAIRSECRSDGHHRCSGGWFGESKRRWPHRVSCAAAGVADIREQAVQQCRGVHERSRAAAGGRGHNSTSQPDQRNYWARRKRGQGRQAGRQRSADGAAGIPNTCVFKNPPVAELQPRGVQTPIPLNLRATGRGDHHRHHRHERGPFRLTGAFPGGAAGATLHTPPTHTHTAHRPGCRAGMQPQLVRPSVPDPHGEAPQYRPHQQAEKRRSNPTPAIPPGPSDFRLARPRRTNARKVTLGLSSSPEPRAPHLRTGYPAVKPYRSAALPCGRSPAAA